MAGLVDAEVTTIHALGGRCWSCRDGGRCERSAQAREALDRWAGAGQVRANLAGYLLDLAGTGPDGAAGTRGRSPQC